MIDFQLQLERVRAASGQMQGRQKTVPWRMWEIPPGRFHVSVLGGAIAYITKKFTIRGTGV